MVARASIIITCYNLGAYVQEAVNSALAQTYADTEVICIDDGSTDQETIMILDQLPPHPRLRVIHTPNQGVARARNYGISQSNSTYILPLDADDRILPTYLEQAIAILEANPRVGFVGCHYSVFGTRESKCCPEAYRLPDMLVENVIPVASVYRRSSWEMVQGYSPEVQFEDWDFWLSILETGYEGHVIPEILFEYRVRPQSRQAINQQSETYPKILACIYTRHQSLYRDHMDAVLYLKDRQFANSLNHSTWLEEQVRSWERTVREHQEMIAVLEEQVRSWERAVREHQDRIAILEVASNPGRQRRAWWHTRIERVKQVTADQPGVLRKGWALGSGVVRVLRRKAKSILAPLVARVWR